MLIQVQVEIAAPLSQVWELWNDPVAITQWNFATPSWHCPSASVDLRVGGKIQSRMEAKDGSMGFDFEGVFSVIETEKYLEYTIADGRAVKVEFEQIQNAVLVRESFEAEDVNSAELQRQGWLAILENFKAYVQSRA